MSDKGRSFSTWVVAATVLVVLVVVAIPLLMPPLGRAGPTARRINCAGNLKQIGLALIIYGGDDVDYGFFPSGSDFRLLHELRYLTDGKIYGCPNCDEPATSSTSSDYAYVGSGLTDMAVSQDRTIIAYERIRNHAHELQDDTRWSWEENTDGWVNCLFANGSVKGVAANTEAEFRKACTERGWILPNPGAATATPTSPEDE